MYIYIYLYISLYLSLSIYIYIYINIGVTSWIKFAYVTLHCVMEFFEGSTLFFNAALIIQRSVAGVKQR